jgi:hypothetical protein
MVENAKTRSVFMLFKFGENRLHQFGPIWGHFLLQTPGNVGGHWGTIRATNEKIGPTIRATIGQTEKMKLGDNWATIRATDPM